ncbi:pyridoxal phosphate-dependent aminotransferase [Halobacteriaceae archaeon GCM10025711]
MTPTTELVTVTNRHNPSGRLVDRDELSALASRVAADGARLLVDEVYAPFVTAEHTVDGPFGAPSAVGLDDTVVTGSLTKFHGLGDVRVGWLIADRAFAAEARRVRHHVPAVARTSVKMAERAVYHADELADRSRNLVAQNASLLTDFVESRDDIDGFVAPDSTFAFLDPEHADGDQLVEAAWENGLLVVPGRFFDDPGRVRVSLGHAPEDMRVALEQLGEVLDRLR